MIRLLSVQPVAERGGSDQALLRMVRSLPPDEFDCHIAVPVPSPMAADFAAAGAAMHVVPMPRLSTSHGPREWAAYTVGWPVAVARLAGLARRLDVDVVHTNSLHSLHGWAAAAIVRRPHVWHAREIVVQSRAALRVERFLARRFATRVIAMSRAVAAQLDPRNVTVVYETADAAEFRPELAGRFRPTAGIPDDVPLAGAAGRLDTWKGIDVLLDAFAEARRRRPELQLAVAGGPVPGKEHFAADLAARAARLPGVHWLGERSDMPAFMADLDVFVLPTTEPEPYGLVVVEALASGAPVIVTDAGGPPEILARARLGGGRLVPPGDAAALADALCAVLPAATRSTARAARPALSPPGPGGRLAAIFREVAAGRRRSVRSPGVG